MGTTGVIRTVLLVDIVALALLALIYLRQRRLSMMEYFGWGMLALLIPVLGPFLVISNRPGEWDPSFSLGSDARRVAEFFSQFINRLLPQPTGWLPCNSGSRRWHPSLSSRSSSRMLRMAVDACSSSARRARSGS